MSLGLRKGDYVKVITGKDKGKMAQIMEVDVKNHRVTIEGKTITPVVKALKARKASDKGGLVQILRTVDASNVMPVCAACGNTTRIKHTEVDGKKVRMCECGAVLETKKVATKEEKKAKTTVRRRVKKAEETEVVTAPENAAPEKQAPVSEEV
jgi:large subunit ribosomal protein L24